MNEEKVEEITIGKHKIEIAIYYALPCATRVFTIDGVSVSAYDFIESRSDRQDCGYGCQNREYFDLPLREVKKNLPKELKRLSAYAIQDIQSMLKERLATGTCGWCI